MAEQATAAAAPFELDVPAAEVDALRARLRGARLPQRFAQGPSAPVRDAATDAGAASPDGLQQRQEEAEWFYGVSRPALDGLLREFEGEFLPRWAERQAALNEAMPQFTLEVETGRTMHFCHQKALPRASPVQGLSRRAAVPIVLLHGWPSTVYDFAKVVPLLAAQGFDVVVPGLMGFAWSKGKEATVEDSARLVVKLMQALGYPHFVAQGGDWGHSVVSFLAAFHSDACVAIHSNMPLVNLSPEVSLVNLNKALRLAANYALPSATLDEREAAAAGRLLSVARTGSAYFLQHIQSPDTLGHALQDSPAGLLAFLAEKYHQHTWEPAANKEALFTTVAVFWFSKCVASSMRFYRNAVLSGDLSRLPSYVGVPTGILCAAGEVLQTPRALSELSFDVRRYTLLDAGGHFLPVERPQALVNDLVEFVDESLPDFDQLVARGKWDGATKPYKEQLAYAAPFVPFVVLGAAALVRSRL